MIFEAFFLRSVLVDGINAENHQIRSAEKLLKITQYTPPLNDCPAKEVSSAGVGSAPTTLSARPLVITFAKV